MTLLRSCDRTRCVNLAIAVLGSISFFSADAANPAAMQTAEVIGGARGGTAMPLLFPYIVSGFGFETEITISNTSQDTSGSVAQSGTCTLNFYAGATSVPTQTTGIVAPGRQLIFTLTKGGSGVLPVGNLSGGYLIANCTFPLARGLAKISAGSNYVMSQDAQPIALPRSAASPQRILIPFVTSASGFDTGIAISNTSRDPFGTTTSSGNCIVNLYGLNAPASFFTPNIAAGAVYTTVLSTIAPNFQGYSVIQCNFSNAANFSFVSNGSAQSVAYAENGESVTLPRSGTKPLLFGAVSNVGGFDTGIAIANTTSDPYGTTHLGGTCTLNFYGTGAPASPFLTPFISTGRVYATVLSQIAPGFKGYVIAVCNFPLARGWAFTQPGTSDGDAFSAEVLTLPRSTTTTGLLFSAVSNWNGNDTAITISNTSQDAFGTAGAQATCRISYYGSMVNGGSTPAAQTSSVIFPGGGQLSFTLSQGNPAQSIAPTPGFRGYLIADCGFPLARGSAYITGVPPGDTVNVTIATAPSGRSFTVDNTTYTSAQTLTWQAGSSHTMNIPSPQIVSAGTRYVFANWTGGGAASVTAPTQNASYVANFDLQYQLTSNVQPAAGGAITPGGWFNAGAIATVSINPNNGYAFSSFTGDLGGSGTVATLTMNAPKNVIANFAAVSPLLTAAIVSRAGTPASRQWTFRLTNSGLDAALPAEIVGVAITQTGGTACTVPPAIAAPPSPATPLNLGPLYPFQFAAGGPVTINFSGCPSVARYSVTISFRANGGTYTGSTTFSNQFY